MANITDQETTVLEPPAEPPPLAPASVVTGRRIVAGLLDLVPMFAVAIAIGERRGASVSLEGMTVIWWLLGGIAYYTVCELLTGTSPGKALVGLCVRNEDTTPPSRQQLALRNLLRIVDVFFMYGVGLLLALTSTKRQRLGDRFAKTVVLRRSEVEPSATFPKGSLAILATVVFATFALGGTLFAQSVAAEDRFGSFSIENDVETYAVTVIEEGLRPPNVAALQPLFLDDLLTADELEEFVSAIDEGYGAAGEYSLRSSTRDLVDVPGHGTLDTVVLVYDVEFEKRDSPVVLTIADIDGQLTVIGLHLP